MPAYTTQLTLGARIGGGHFGDVFEGQCAVHGRVAVKVLRQNPGETPADWARRSEELLQEARKLQTARHANVVEVFQVAKDSTNDVVHLVAEFCNGGSVEDAYKRGPHTLPDARTIVTDVCRGLECVHSHGMIHRDIKPANILRHTHTYKIGDFGLVSDRLVLGYGSADGYISHLAPEVFGASGGVTGTTSAKTDVWALGMTVYRLLHGHNFYSDAFGLKTKDEIREMIVSDGFSYRLPWLPHVPEPWRKFVRKAMHDDACQRFQTAHAMSQALARLSIEPIWNCQYTFDHVKWTRNDGDRVILVEWYIHSPRKHEWSAKRTGAGKRVLVVAGAPGKVVSSRTAKEQLENFFATSV